MDSEGALSEGNMRKRCRLFKGGRINAQDEERICGAGSSSENFRKSPIEPRPCIKFLSLSVNQEIFGRSEPEERPRAKMRRPGLAGRLGSGLFDEDV